MTLSEDVARLAARTGSLGDWLMAIEDTPHLLMDSIDAARADREAEQAFRTDVIRLLTRLVAAFE